MQEKYDLNLQRGIIFTIVLYLVLKSRQVRLEGSLTEVYFDNVLHRKECLHIQKKKCN